MNEAEDTSSSSRSHLVVGSLRQTQFSSSQFCHVLNLCRSDGSHVSVDIVLPSLLRSSSLSSLRCYHLQSLSSDVVLVSPLYVANPPQSCLPAPLRVSLSLVLSFLTWYLSVWPHAHLHILISVTSSFFTWELVTGTVSIPYSIARWTIVLWIFPLTCGGRCTLLSHRTPDIFLHFFIHTVSSC